MASTGHDRSSEDRSHAEPRHQETERLRTPVEGPLGQDWEDRRILLEDEPADHRDAEDRGSHPIVGDMPESVSKPARSRLGQGPRVESTPVEGEEQAEEHEIADCVEDEAGPRPDPGDEQARQRGTDDASAIVDRRLQGDRSTKLVPAGKLRKEGLASRNLDAPSEAEGEAEQEDMPRLDLASDCEHGERRARDRH
jgi:hypothetical protein